jgi:hypothetical protein
MLWVLAALACNSSGSPNNESHVESGDDTATAGPCGNGIDESGNGTPDGCNWSGELALEGTSLYSGSDNFAPSGLAVCDANGDGVDDVVIAAPEASGTGAVYVFYGPIRDDRDVKAADYTLEGPQEGVYTGWSADCRRDIDGDGAADLIVGELREGDGEHYSGGVYLVPGSGTGTQPIEDEASSMWIRLSGGDRLGYQVVAIDTDGDETDELAIALGLPDSTPDAFGIAYVFEDAGVRISEADAAVAYIYGEQDDPIEGAIGNAGDLDGDGVEELAISGTDEASEELLVFGGPLVGPIAKADADVRIVSDSDDTVEWSGFGHADLDADGRDDLFVGDMHYDNFDGAVFAFFGPIADDNSTSSAGLRIVGVPDVYKMGSDVTSPGDVDGDGTPDLLIGATFSGTVYLQYGGGPGVYDLANAQAWWREQGTVGLSVSAGGALAAGDVTADGVVDFVISSPSSGNGSGHAVSVTIMPSFDL